LEWPLLYAFLAASTDQVDSAAFSTVFNWLITFRCLRVSSRLVVTPEDANEMLTENLSQQISHQDVVLNHTIWGKDAIRLYLPEFAVPNLDFAARRWSR
jgi:hypothetical protein